jgi:hypothetical protein
MKKLFGDKTFNWWQIGLLKLSLISFGVIIGVYWFGFFIDWLLVLWILFLAPAAYLLYVHWLKD